MNPQNFIKTTLGLFLGTCTLLKGQVSSTDSSSNRHPPCDTNLVSTSPQPEIDAKKLFWLWRDIDFTGGQLTLPFKIRPDAEKHSFRLTTDVTIGGFVGITKRLSAKREMFLTIPLAAGLTFINLNNNNTVLDRSEQDAEVVPGLTWSTGLVLQLEKYSLGLMFGKDYASEVGDQWAYHARMWWSFGIGFSFVKEKE